MIGERIMDIKTVSAGLSSRVTDNNSQQTKTNNQVSSPTAKGLSDKVTLSSSVKDLEQTAKSATVDNSARISELKESIKDNSYQVNAESVASKLLATETLIVGA